MENNQRSSSNPHIAKPVLCDGFLIPMTDFVLRINYIEKEIDQFFDSWRMKQLRIIENYAKFLKQPLKLEMFVPLDDEGDFVEKPSKETYELSKIYNHTASRWLIEDYEKAKEKVLFEGFEFVSRTDETWLFKINGNFPRIVGKKLTIESLRIFKDKIKLSQTALNSIFGETVA